MRRKTGAQVRDYHIGIKGVDEQGRRYSALNPDVFYWAHATFFKSTLLAAEWLGGGLTEAEKRQLFDEHITWYRMYGMSMRPVPNTWEEFQEYWDHMCHNVLENNYATREVLDLSTMTKHPSLEWMPDWLWRLNVAGMQRFFTLRPSGCSTLLSVSCWATRGRRARSGYTASSARRCTGRLGCCRSAC